VDLTLFIIQLLNGLQLGLLLFLVASGLTLVFGILDFVNLAHGALYMLGAFVCASLTLALGNFLWAVLLSLPITAAIGWSSNGWSRGRSMPATTSTRCWPPSG
jgi:branched-chain amino acid transport system permease protein